MIFTGIIHQGEDGGNRREGSKFGTGKIEIKYFITKEFMYDYCLFFDSKLHPFDCCPYSLSYSSL